MQQYLGLNATTKARFQSVRPISFHLGRGGASSVPLIPTADLKACSLPAGAAIVNINKASKVWEVNLACKVEEAASGVPANAWHPHFLVPCASPDAGAAQASLTNIPQIPQTLPSPTS